MFAEGLFDKLIDQNLPLINTNPDKEIIIEKQDNLKEEEALALDIQGIKQIKIQSNPNKF